MADDAKRSSLLLGLLLGAAVVVLGVLFYAYYQQQREVVKIDVPGFSGEITKDKGVDIEIGKDR
jgi:hypothetical protein